MKKAQIIFIALLMISAAANAQQKTTTKKETKKEAAQPAKWAVDPAHSSIKFTVKHLTVSEVEGRFKTFDGTVETTGADFVDSKVNFNVDVPSISTDNDMRDKHLKSDDFFNAEKYPKMTFTSVSFKRSTGGNYVLEGDLTIRDVTKRMKFAVSYGGTMVEPYGNTKAGFRAIGHISRKAYNLKWNTLTEAGGAVVGDEVTILLNLEFAKQK